MLQSDLLLNISPSKILYYTLVLKIPWDWLWLPGSLVGSISFSKKKIQASMFKNNALNPGRVKCFICHLRRAWIMCTLQRASAVKLWNYRARDLAMLTCPPPSSLHRSIAKAKSIAANTASASVLWEARISCRRLSYITGSKKAKSCQFTY